MHKVGFEHNFRRECVYIRRTFGPPDLPTANRRFLLRVSRWRRPLLSCFQSPGYNTVMYLASLACFFSHEFSRFPGVVYLFLISLHMFFFVLYGTPLMLIHRYRGCQCKSTLFKLSGITIALYVPINHPRCARQRSTEHWHRRHIILSRTAQRANQTLKRASPGLVNAVRASRSPSHPPLSLLKGRRRARVERHDLQLSSSESVETLRLVVRPCPWDTSIL